MENPVKKLADENEIVSFLEKLGIKLSPEALEELRKRIKEEPIEKKTLRRSREMTKNEVFKSVIDLTLTEKARRIESNPLFQAVKEARDKFMQNKVKEIAYEKLTWDRLNKIFYDESKWERFYPDILNVDEDGTIVRIQDHGSLKMYLGFLRKKTIKGKQELTLLTTKRERLWEGIAKGKYWKLKENPEIYNLEKKFYEFILDKVNKIK